MKLWDCGQARRVPRGLAMPFPGHRTLAQVDADKRFMAERLKARERQYPRSIPRRFDDPKGHA